LNPGKEAYMSVKSIGEAASASGVTAKMIRHYEDMHLIPPPTRTLSGYRMYSEQDVHNLRFIRRARSLGFSIKQIGDLLGLWRDKSRSSAKVKALALDHIAELEQKIAEMQAMKAELEHLANCCHGDQRPECPIIDRLADEAIKY
jgi:MerR family copper efflux transcriptional regulator